MKHFHSVLPYLMITVVLAGMQFSCQNAEPDYEVVELFSQDQYFVSAEEAAAMASVLEFSKGKNPGETGFKSVNSATPVPNKKGETVYYIINYQEGGFIIIAADKRVAPILAYSATSNFSLEAEEYPGGLVSWLAETRDYINFVRSPGFKSTQNTASLWAVCPAQKLVEPPTDDDCGDGGCTDQHTQVGPLLTTTWNQTQGYNDAAPFMVDIGLVEIPSDECPPGGSCCQALTGCVATAMAQLIRYHEFPNTYDWAAMPDNGWGTLEIAQLMRDAGDAVDMEWGCNGSGASQSNIAPALKNVFGYSTASSADFNYVTVKNNLNQDKPVILSGGSKEGWWIFATYENGHAWVCDGYMSHFFCDSGISTLHLWMNWGWGGADDGWYAFNNWNPGGNTFNYKKEMVYNINP